MMLAGFYEKEITPGFGSHMPGGFELNRANGVKERLMVKGAAFELNDKRIIVLSADALFIPQKTYDIAIKKIYEYTGITEKNILIQATHTHTGGPVKGNANNEGQDDVYINWLGDMVADCGIAAFHRMIPVMAKFAKCTVEGVTFIRNYVMKDGNIRTNPRPKDSDVIKPFGTPDTEFQTLYFINEQGSAIGSIMNFALHHCCVGGTEFCADYSAVLARELKLHFGMDYVNVMLSGTSGNLNHFDFFAVDRWRNDKKTPRYVQIGKILAEAALRLFDEAQPMALNELAAEKVILQVKRRKVSDELLKEVNQLTEEIPFEEIADLGNISQTETKAYLRSKAPVIIEMAQMPDTLPMCVQAIRLGECMLYGLSGEIYAEFGLDIKKKSPGKYSMIASLANAGTYCYVPTKESYNTTIYEAQLPSARLESETGYLMADKAIELAKKMY